VIFVIRYLANGIVGDWGKIQRLWSKPKELPSASAGN
jgi:branched-chain amino acid transport system permease protein